MPTAQRTRKLGSAVGGCAGARPGRERAHPARAVGSRITPLGPVAVAVLHLPLYWGGSR